jgi:hypothetical protein
MAETILLTKSKHWEYEQEWRIIDHETGTGPKEFPSELLTGIILGCEMIDKDRKEVLEWLRNETVTVYVARPKEQSFGVDIVKIN